ncbi:MAG: hypothetical protein NT069_08115, partial [Planctomycetota bacterium]|nr:hypothetical protein [Planctomycetota bacterium]
ADGNAATVATVSRNGARPEVLSVVVDGWTISLRGSNQPGSRIRMQSDDDGKAYEATGGVTVSIEPPGNDDQDSAAYVLQADEIAVAVPKRAETINRPGWKRVQIEARGNVKFLADKKLHAMVSLARDGDVKDRFDADQVQLSLPISELRGVVQLSGGLTSNQSQTPAEGRVKPGETIRVPIGTEQRIRVPVLNSGAKGDETQIRTYAVADLVISPQTVVVAGDPQANDLETQKMAPEFKESDLDAVAELISTTIAPDSWDADAGRTIRPNVSSLSLVIRQSSGVHQQIADLLKQVRTLQDVQIGIELNRFELATEEFASAVEQSGSLTLRPLTATEAKVAVAVATADSRRLLASLLPKTPKSEKVKITLQGGQAADLLASALGTQFANDEGRLRIQPLTGGTLHKLQLQLSWRESATGAASRQIEKTLRVGESLVVDLTAFRQGRADQGEVGVPILNKIPQVDRLFKNAGPNLPAERTYLVITPRLVLAEPEEAIRE